MDHDESEKLYAIDLVREEMIANPPRDDYLDYLPDYSKRPFRTYLLDATEKMISNESITRVDQNIDQVRLNTPPPVGSVMHKEESKAWKRCLDQLQIKIEYNQKQMTSLELLRSYGAKNWQSYIEFCEKVNLTMKTEMQAIETTTHNMTTSNQ